VISVGACNPVLGSWLIACRPRTWPLSLKGTPVVAALSGRVSAAAWRPGYGHGLELEHQSPKRRRSTATCSSCFVKEGEWVEQGPR